RLNQLPPSRATQCAVVGFGSYAYPDFCQYALEVEAALKSQENCVLQDAAYLIHNKSYTSFQTWAHNWGDQLNLRLDLAPSLPTVKTKVSHFTVIQKQSIQDGFGDTFLLTLQANGVPFRSGDLLAIEPPEDPVERLYSIAKIQGNQVLLSVKRHEQGVCSNYLNRLGVADKLEAGIQSNKEFHFPERVPSATLISNGTGIAPFLGMIQEKRMHTEVYLYWGGRNSQSYALYEPWIAAALDRKSLDHIAVAYSREESPYAYVQDIVRNIQREIAERLHQGGVIMLCGSIGMQNAVLKLLEEICEKHTGEKLSYYQNRGQILMDCY
ncbi:MAG: FAD-binding oxidoreductase, partial [Bacteroidota bacterium]